MKLTLKQYLAHTTTLFNTIESITHSKLRDYTDEDIVINASRNKLENFWASRRGNPTIMKLGISNIIYEP